MAEVDTSSYPRAAALPAQKSALDQAQQFGALQQQQQSIQSGALTIDKQKLDLVNQRFAEMSKGFVGLMAKPDLTQDDVRKYVQTQVKLGYVPPDMAATTLSELPNTQGMPPAQASKVLKDALGIHLQHAGTMVEAINNQFGTNAVQQDNANTYQGVVRSPIQGGGFEPKTQMPTQLPPTQPIVGSDLRPGVVGPSGPAGVQPAVPTPRPRPGLPVASNPAGPPPASGPTGPTVDNGSEFNNRFSAAFPNAVATGAAPGQAEAAQAVAGQSGKDYATALTTARNYKADLYPMERVLESVHNLGENAFGPGTDTLNDAKAILATWGNLPKEELDKIADRASAKKYLVQLARTSGNTGTNDQLAAAFEGTPNTKMTGATIETVVKSNLALRRMQHAQTLMALENKVPKDQFSEWIARNQNVLDPRAFGFDLMDDRAKDKLLSTMATQDPKDPRNWIPKKGKEKEFNRFEQSIQFALKSDLISPKGQ
jgi:hypothetical protein